jgi:hypothetical protein
MRNLFTPNSILKIDQFLKFRAKYLSLKILRGLTAAVWVILFTGACAPIAAPAPTVQPTSIPAAALPEDHNSWRPQPGVRLQIQYADYPPDLNVDAQVFSLDLFETSAEDIDALHARGKQVICYLNSGSWEEYRPDADDFPEDVIGKDYEGWPGEKWLDIRRFAEFAAVMQARFDLAVEKGCDGIDADNMQNYDEDTGFAISAADQLAYNHWLSQQAHSRGLAIGLKNDPGQAAELVDWFDWSLVEDCSVYEWCGELRPFAQAGKAVFQVEYTDDWPSGAPFCAEAADLGYSALLKNRGLDAWVSYCNLPESE